MKKQSIFALLALVSLSAFGMEKRPASYMSPYNPYKSYNDAGSAYESNYEFEPVSPTYSAPQEYDFPTPEPAVDLSQDIQEFRQWQKNSPLKRRDTQRMRRIARENMHQFEANQEERMWPLLRAIQQGKVQSRSKRR